MDCFHDFICILKNEHSLCFRPKKKYLLTFFFRACLHSGTFLLVQAIGLQFATFKLIFNVKNYLQTLRFMSSLFRLNFEVDRKRVCWYPHDIFELTFRLFPTTYVHLLDDGVWLFLLKLESTKKNINNVSYTIHINICKVTYIIRKNDKINIVTSSEMIYNKFIQLNWK